MPILDLEKLLAPLSEEAPAGENLEDFSYEPEVVALESASRGTPERAIGDEVVEAGEPVWREIKPAAIALFDKGKSLSVAVCLTRAITSLQGSSGLAEGLELIHELLVRYWDNLHPVLDEEDDNDPTERLNTLVQIADADSTLKEVANVQIVAAPALGKYSIRDYLIASGKRPAPKDMDQPPSLAAISGAMMECDLDQLRDTQSALSKARQLSMDIQSTVDSKVAAGTPFDITPLTKLLETVTPFISESMQRRGLVTTEDGSVTEAGDPVAGAPVPMAGEITSRDDVIRMLDKACEYFNVNEPSSPVPMLLQRAKRLVSQDFLSILKDIAPDGVDQAQQLGGAEPEE